MNLLYRILKSRWFRTFFGVAILCILIWFCGPLIGLGQIHPWETDIARWLTIVLLLVLWLVVNLVHEVRASRRDKKLTDGLIEAAPDPAELASAEEVALLRDRFREALKTLKTAKIDGTSRKHLAALPWYIFIGPPGAGKTTALRNCGLKFPLADVRGGADMLKGVGGTRNCDWWFTDEAVLIDTAGRYVTQDSEATVDKAAWLGFLRLLKKYRSRQPLNGVIVSISLSDLATLSDEERQAHAQAIRRRVRELQDELDVRIPVYCLFTKADLIAGFGEFFGKLGREERDQVWGMTFPLDRGTDDNGAVADFAAGFDGLVARVNDRLLERIHEETDLNRRRLIYGFPQQLLSLRDVAQEFLTDCFKPSRLEARPLLRGVYFTSGTQEGTPIDRLLGVMAAQFGLPRQPSASFTMRGQSFFLSRLMREVIFGEAALAGLDPRVERYRRFATYGTYAACGVALLTVAGLWFSSFLGNRDLAARVNASAGVYETQFNELTKRGPMDTDLAAVVPPLNTLRHVRRGYDERDTEVPLALTFGLYQGDKLGVAASDAYVRALDGLLLPRLIARLEAQVRAQMTNPDLLYPLLKVYLVLGRQGPLDKDLVLQWLSRHLSETYPGDDDATTREALINHATAMVSRPLTSLVLEEGLIAGARDVLNKEPLALYSYNRILRSKRVMALTPWSVADKGGPGVARLFQLNSKRPLETSIPGIYTWAGYHDVFLPILPSITRDLSEDAWVLGRAKRDLLSVAKDTNKLRREVMGLYLLDYERKWDDMLADIAIRPFSGNLQQALDQLSLLAAPISPFREVLQSIDTQTQLSRSGATDAAVAAAQDRAGRIAGQTAGIAGQEVRKGLTSLQNQGLSIMTEAFGTDAAGRTNDPTRQVDEHFKALHIYVAGPDDKPPSGLDLTVRKFDAMYKVLSETAASPAAGASMLNQVAGGGGAAVAAMAQTQDIGRDLPRPIAAMLATVTREVSNVQRAGAGQEVANAWKSRVLPLCEAAFNRYPMVYPSPADVPVDDFGKLLAPGGVMDQFFTQYLKPFADISRKPWKWQSPEAIPSGLSAGSLAPFERAADIRDAFWGNGKDISIKFELAIASLDPQLAQISIDVAGSRLVGNHGPPERARFQWPGTDGKTLVQVTMTPAKGGNEYVVLQDGPWALLRVLDTAKITPSAQPDKFRISFAGAGGSATFELNASSVNNPFTLASLRSFRCPQKL